MSDLAPIDQPEYVQGRFARMLAWLMGRPFITGAICGVLGFAVLAFGMVGASTSQDGAYESAVYELNITHLHGPQEAKAHVSEAHDEAVAHEHDAPEHDIHAAPPKETETALALATKAPERVVAESALIVSNIGLSRRVAEALNVLLPQEVSVGVSVYASNPAAYGRAFKGTGRNVWLQLAAQSTKKGVDPGPLALSAGLREKDNANLLARQLKAAGNDIMGVYLPHDADITLEGDIWRNLGLNILGHDLIILDATKAPVATTLYMQKALSNISAYLKTNKVIDGAQTAAAIDAQLQAATKIILTEKEAIIALENPTIIALERVAKWLEAIKKAHIKLVPADKFTGLKP